MPEQAIAQPQPIPSTAPDAKRQLSQRAMLGKHTNTISLAALTPLKHKPSIPMTMKTHDPIMQLTLPQTKTLSKASSTSSAPWHSMTASLPAYKQSSHKTNQSGQVSYII